MRNSGLIALALVAIGCRTHTVDECLPPCGAEDQFFFARCVAEGSDDPCEAGNRRCCALAAACLGDLDDQTVVTTLTSCTNVDSANCLPPCTAADVTTYDACFSSGSSTCRAGDETCCALAADCLGSLGDVSVSADGCCSSDDDCPRGLTCDSLMTWTCVGAVAGCGDGVVSGTEQCDDHNDVTESCAYGAMSCTVCDASCHLVAGATHFCGDMTVDLTEGEACDPPEAMICDASCHSLQPASCTNRIQDGTESDVDCGGRQCAGCLAGGTCRSLGDCRAQFPQCMGIADCTGTPTSPGVCVETTTCDDGDSCTDDACDASSNCTTHLRIDRDHDGDGPLSADCGLDCNDADPTIHSGAAELCDGVDQDCDAMIDESCT